MSGAKPDLFECVIDPLREDEKLSLRLVRAWADSFELGWDGEECDGISFYKGDRMYFHMLDDGWDLDDPRNEMIAELTAELDALKKAQS